MEVLETGLRRFILPDMTSPNGTDASAWHNEMMKMDFQTLLGLSLKECVALHGPNPMMAVLLYERLQHAQERYVCGKWLIENNQTRIAYLGFTWPTLREFTLENCIFWAGTGWRGIALFNAITKRKEEETVCWNQ
jgi:hypothetical protein